MWRCDAMKRLKPVTQSSALRQKLIYNIMYFIYLFILEISIEREIQLWLCLCVRTHIRIRIHLYKKEYKTNMAQQSETKFQ